MEFIRKLAKPIAIFLSFHMLMLACPFQSVLAAMIETESIVGEEQGQRLRDHLNNLLARKEIQAALISKGIDPQEAQDRIDNLSDDEIRKLVREMDQIPAGGAFFEALIIIALVVFLVLLATDISGYTDVFPFVNKHASNKITPNEKTDDTSGTKQIRPSIKDTGINPDDNLIIYFKRGSNDLTAAAIQSLNRVVEFMSENAKIKIDIIGFSDSTVSESYDVMLSENRANTVKSYLLAKGIDPKKISSFGMGAPGFSAIEGNEEERQMIGGAAIEFERLPTK